MSWNSIKIHILTFHALGNFGVVFCDDSMFIWRQYLLFIGISVLSLDMNVDISFTASLTKQLKTQLQY